MFGLAICVLFVYSNTGFTSGQTVINFCPNKSIHSSVSVRLEETLIIDGSDAAIVSQDLPAGMTTCECAITYMYYGLELPESPVDKDSESNTSHTLGKGRQFDEEAPLPKLLVQSRTDNTSRCGKSVKVTQIEDNDLHWLRCSSRDVEFEEIPRYGTMKMTLSVELPKPADTLYQVELKAGGATADFYVTCLPPVLSRTTQTPSSSRTTHAPSSSRTTQSPSSSRTTNAPSSSRTTQSPSSSRTTHAPSPDLFTMKPPEDPNSNSLSDGSDNTAIVIGVVVIIAFISACIVIVAVVCMRKRRHFRNSQQGEAVNHCGTVQENNGDRKDLTKDNNYVTLESRKAAESHNNTDAESGIYDFILSEDVEESIADETNEYDSIPKENNMYYQLGLSEPLSSTYLGLGSKNDCSNTNLKCEVNKSVESKCEPQDDYLEPGKVIPDYLEILPSLD